jgi:hypothetical protein
VSEHLDELALRIETIERGYEYLLAFAAQGRRDDGGSDARSTLLAMHAALTDLGAIAGAALRAAWPAGATGPVGPEPFVGTLAEDADKAAGAFGLVLGCPAISSLLVDNLNASIHVRALLTDLFLIDQALRPR